MSRYSYEFYNLPEDMDECPTRKSSALQTYYDYHGCYPEGYEASDDMPTFASVS